MDGWSHGACSDRRVHPCLGAGRGGMGVNIFSLIMNLGVFLFPKGPCIQHPTPCCHLPSLCPSISLPPHVRELTVKRCDYHRSVLTQTISLAPEPLSSARPGPHTSALAQGQKLFSGGENVRSLGDGSKAVYRGGGTVKSET